MSRLTRGDHDAPVYTVRRGTGRRTLAVPFGCSRCSLRLGPCQCRLHAIQFAESLPNGGGSVFDRAGNRVWPRDEEQVAR